MAGILYTLLCLIMLYSHYSEYTKRTLHWHGFYPAFWGLVLPFYSTSPHGIKPFVSYGPQYYFIELNNTEVRVLGKFNLDDNEIGFTQSNKGELQ